MSGLVRTQEQYEYVLDGMRNRMVLAVDTESTGLHPYQDDVIRGASVCWSDDEFWYVPFTHPHSTNFDPAAFADTLGTAELLVMHHKNYDLAVLDQLDEFEIPEPDRVFDTQSIMYMLNENVPVGQKEIAARLWGDSEKDEQRVLAEIRRGRLKSDCNAQAKAELREAHGEKVKLKDHKEWLNERALQLQAESKRDWPTFTAEDIGQYAANDASQAWRIYWWAMKQLAREDRNDLPTPAVRREMRFVDVVRRMVERGIAVDTEHTQAQWDEADTERQRLEQTAGFEGVNFRSHPQVRRLLYNDWRLPIINYTQGGEASTDRATCEALLDETADHRLEALLDHRRVQKALSGYYTPMLRYVGPDGRIHPSFNCARTVTTRLSCSEPNLQTIPKDYTIPGVRECFVPGKGTELWEYDLAGAELRIISSFARETWMVQALEEGRDLHSETAAEVFGPDFTPAQRGVAKNINFTAPYFGGPKPIARYMSVGPPRVRVDRALLFKAEQALARWRKKNPRIWRMMNYLQAVAKRDGIMPLHVRGVYRRFHAPGVVVPYYTAFNAIVQGGIGQLMRDVMLEAELYNPVSGDMVLQVHDSLVFEVKPGNGPVVQAELQGILDRINPFDITMRFDAKEWGT